MTDYSELYEYLKKELSQEELFDLAWAIGRSYDAKLISDICSLDERFDQKPLMNLMQEGIEFTNSANQVYCFARKMSDCGRKNVNYARLQNRIIELGDAKTLILSRSIPEFDKNTFDIAMLKVSTDQSELETYFSLIEKDENLDEDTKLKLAQLFNSRMEAIKSKND